MNRHGTTMLRHVRFDCVHSTKVRTGVLSLEKSAVPLAWRAASACRSTTLTLLLSGDSYTAWNARKRALLPSALAAELAFNAVVLRRHAKAASAWSHRRWCLCRAGLADDWELCEVLALRFPRNYYAWTHRAWLAERSESRNNELSFVERWLMTHVTDYSAAHYAVRIASGRYDDLVELRNLCRRLRDTYPHLATNCVGALSYFERSIAHAFLAAELSEPTYPPPSVHLRPWIENCLQAGMEHMSDSSA